MLWFVVQQLVQNVLLRESPVAAEEDSPSRSNLFQHALQLTGAAEAVPVWDSGTHPPHRHSPLLTPW